MLNDETAVVPGIGVDERIPLEAHPATLDELQSLDTLANRAALALDRVGLDDAPFTPRLDPAHNR